jgi:hypothetical protein
VILHRAAADNVLEFEVVTASGQYVTANAAQNTDLFWAMKGGGPATFGVALSVTMKTFPDIKSAGAIMYINSTHTTDSAVWWKGFTAFHKHSNHFVDNGLYVYFEVFPQTLRIRPWVAIGKTAAELKVILQPMVDELNAQGIPFELTFKDFPTFYDLYTDLFEPETPGNSALTGGWMFSHEDVALRNDQIIDSFKTALAPRADVSGVLIGHLFNPGYGLPVANSATHPAWRNATDFVITIVPVPVGSSLAQKADLQNLLTYTVDEGLRKAGPKGCTYVHEVRISGARLGVPCREDKLESPLLTMCCRLIRTSQIGKIISGDPLIHSSSRSDKNGIQMVSSMPFLLREPSNGKLLRMARDSARNFESFLWFMTDASLSIINLTGPGY